MAAPLYTGVTGGAVALVAATAKTVMGFKAHANSGLLLKEASFSFDGITANAIPVLAELVYATWASNSPGTNSTSITPLQISGRSMAVGFTAGKNWSAEPTVLTVLYELLVHPQAGLIYQIPLGDEVDCALAEGFALRFTAPAGVNVRTTMKVSRA